MLRLIPRLLAGLCALLVPLVADAAPREAAIHLPAGARVQLSALVDGYTVGLYVVGVEGRALERALLALHGEKVTVLSARGRTALAYVQFAERVVAAEARLGKTNAKRDVQVHLHVTTEAPRDAMLAHVLDVELPVPKTLETDALARADAAFVHKRLAEAEILLQQMEASGMQRAWVMLRLGDLAVFHDKVGDACAAYDEAQTDGGMRTASTLAALRARVLGCAPRQNARHSAASQAFATTEAVDWALLLRRTGRDDPIGRRVAQEAHWALAYERDPAVLREVLALEGPAYREHLDVGLREALLARLLRRSPPFALATSSVRGVPLARHPEAFDLALGFGLAWCALDVPDGWQPPAARSRSWMNLPRRERARLVQEVGACALVGDAKVGAGGHEGNVLSADKTKPGAHLVALRARLEGVQRVLDTRLAASSAADASFAAH